MFQNVFVLSSKLYIKCVSSFCLMRYFAKHASTECRSSARPFPIPIRTGLFQQSFRYSADNLLRFGPRHSGARSYRVRFLSSSRFEAGIGRRWISDRQLALSPIRRCEYGAARLRWVEETLISGPGAAGSGAEIFARSP